MKTLLAIDSSPYADEIFSEVADRKWPDDVKFLVISVVGQTGDGEVDQQFAHQAQIILDSRVEVLKKKLPASCNLTGEVLEGTPAEVILDTARDWSADLIVIGSHGDTGVRKEGLGSVAAAVVNESPCTVEVVKIRTRKLQLQGGKV